MENRLIWGVVVFLALLVGLFIGITLPAEEQPVLECEVCYDCPSVDPIVIEIEVEVPGECQLDEDEAEEQREIYEQENHTDTHSYITTRTCKDFLSRDWYDDRVIVSYLDTKDGCEVYYAYK